VIIVMNITFVWLG